MRTIELSILSVFLFSLPSCGVPWPRAANAATTCPEAGKHVERLVIDGIGRELIVHVPRSPCPSAKKPAVIMFHGTSGDGQKFYDISGWREKADAEGLVAVFPTALTYCHKEDDNADGDFDDAGEAKVATKWADGQLGNAQTMPLCTAKEIAKLPAPKRRSADHGLKDDVAFTGAIIDLLAARYEVDPRRVYATGFSNGANFTSRLALELSERIAAVAAASGRLQLPAVPAARAVSVLISVGNKDARLNAKLGVTSLPLAQTLLTDVPEIHSRVLVPMLTTLQIEDRPVFEERLVSGKRLVQFKHDTSAVAASNDLRFLVIEDLDHQYPNGRNHPVVAADLLWRFFRSKSL